MLDRVNSRVDPLIEYCKGKSVLNIGGVGMGVNDTFEMSGSNAIIAGRDFHLPRVKEVAKELVVVDIQKDKLEILQKYGYKTLCQSADEYFCIAADSLPHVDCRCHECVDAHKRFDVVLAEEIIEHLQDLRVFMNNVKRHLKDDGTFLITSPSPWGWAYTLQRILYGKERSNNFHTHWQSEKTMRYLLESNGFEVISVRYIDAVSENLQGRIIQNLLRWLPHHWGINVIYQVRLRK